MKIDFLDRSNYLKGLLILIGKDNLVSEEERELVMKAGHKLGFEKQFCITAINEILENEYISNTPPHFSNKSIAKSFIIDGIKLAFIDHDYDDREIDYLKLIAEVNNIEGTWIDNALKDAWKLKSVINENLYLEIENFL
ncbi:MAG: hypothetical protein KJ571_17950 [Bacteroidetes bacterium]|nr:hypothetical protein [Bacteroidota bacterium]